LHCFCCIYYFIIIILLQDGTAHAPPIGFDLAATTSLPKVQVKINFPNLHEWPQRRSWFCMYLLISGELSWGASYQRHHSQFSTAVCTIVCVTDGQISCVWPDSHSCTWLLSCIVLTASKHQIWPLLQSLFEMLDVMTSSITFISFIY